MLILITTSCSQEQVEMDSLPKLMEVIEADTSLNIFTDAVKRVNLITTLNSSQHLTLFAPTDYVFNKFFNKSGYSDLDDIPTQELKHLVLNHFLSGSLKNTELFSGYYRTLSKNTVSNGNLTLYIDTGAGLQLNRESWVIEPNLEASNGFVHKVSGIIPQPSLYNLVTNDHFLLFFRVAINRQDLTSGYKYNLTTSSPVTLLVPTNDAIAQFLGSEPGFKDISDIPLEVVEQILDNHILKGVNISSDKFGSHIPIESEGKSYYFEPDNGNTIVRMGSDIYTNILLPDLFATNGVMHIVDQILY